MRTKAAAVALAGLVLVASAPPLAVADDGQEEGSFWREGPWGQWARRLGDREAKGEVPFAAVITLPAMILITPIWVGGEAIERPRGEE